MKKCISALPFSLRVAGPLHVDVGDTALGPSDRERRGEARQLSAIGTGKATGAQVQESGGELYFVAHTLVYDDKERGIEEKRKSRRGESAGCTLRGRPSVRART